MIVFNPQDGEPVLLSAAYNGELEAVEALVRAGADVNASDEPGDADGITQNDVMRRLDPNFRSGTTPLLAAAEQGHTEVVEYLVKAGADVNAETGVRCNTSCVCFLGGNVVVVCLGGLLFYGTIAHARRRTPTHHHGRGGRRCSSLLGTVTWTWCSVW